jgi:hypothetical protein
VSFEFRAATLKRFNPLPYLLQLLLEVHGLAQSGALYSVLAELYSNALEHGVLGLDSGLKRDASGFARYYQQRNVRLDALQDGFVRVHLQVTPQGEGGCLAICVEDSGKGFDVERVLERPLDPVRLSGRGISLIRSWGAMPAGPTMVAVPAWSFTGRLWHNPRILDQGVSKWLTNISTRTCLARCARSWRASIRSWWIPSCRFRKRLQLLKQAADAAVP